MTVRVDLVQNNSPMQPAQDPLVFPHHTPDTLNYILHQFGIARDKPNLFEDSELFTSPRYVQDNIVGEVSVWDSVLFSSVGFDFGAEQADVHDSAGNVRGLAFAAERDFFANHERV
eukprot:CAMPEP_0196595394 /NCGR_PEP_ID=MMETSP1081-20130531/80993_1 /TAXON_ID=36882 /ORGANISM="Pyramimonas amylifera, Strain CCMP720" /LENGTH=115 /DNA_ID=CAMNT_0041919949 /DNA_START=375 /DNA_END=722 /DNA_ORIENTATION=+